MKRVFIPCAMIWMLTTHAFAWGPQGHEAIAEAAQEHLNTHAASQVAKLLGKSTLASGDLAKIATWPDAIRVLLPGHVGKVEAGLDLKEARTFNANHKNNALWHYVNLPLGAQAYPDLHTAHVDDPVVHFTSADDVVQMINTCIQIVESANEEDTFTKGQALRWLVHLVGDIHQPLHVVTGYYRASSNLAQPTLISDPAEALKGNVVSDEGGNGLLFGSEKLHALWDHCLVELVDGATSCSNISSAGKAYQTLAQKLSASMKEAKAASFKTPGDHHDWAVQWATDSLKVAVSTKAFDFKLAQGVIDPHHQGQTYLQATITPPPMKKTYLQDHTIAVSSQLTKAAVRLADLLNQINWK